MFDRSLNVRGLGLLRGGGDVDRLAVRAGETDEPVHLVGFAWATRTTAMNGRLHLRPLRRALGDGFTGGGWEIQLHDAVAGFEHQRFRQSFTAEIVKLHRAAQLLRRGLRCGVGRKPSQRTTRRLRGRIRVRAARRAGESTGENYEKGALPCEPCPSTTAK
jgi:hypothetical protein